MLWLCESYFGICSWETNGYLPPGRISIPRILALFDEILSGAANPTDAHVRPPPSSFTLLFSTPRPNHHLTTPNLPTLCFPCPHPTPYLHVPRILFERFITRTLSLCSPGQMSTAWQTDRRISRVLQSIFDCLLSQPDFLSSQTQAFSLRWHWFISQLTLCHSVFVAFLYLLLDLIYYVCVSIQNQHVSALGLLLWHFTGSEEKPSVSDFSLMNIRVDSKLCLAPEYLE